MCMIDDAEPYLLYARKKGVRARKPHQCYECSRMIEVGETYTYVSGLYEGRWDSIHECAHCSWAAEWLLENCNGYLHGAVFDDLYEHWSYELIRTLDLGRRIVWIRRRWRDKLGNLIPVPQQGASA